MSSLLYILWWYFLFDQFVGITEFKYSWLLYNVLFHCQVADTWEALDGWLDAIRLVYTIFARGKSDVLAGVITG